MDAPALQQPLIGRHHSIRGIEDPILNEAQTKHATSLSRTQRWRMIRAGTFPKRVQISDGRGGWRSSDINAFNAGKRDWGDTP